MLIISTKVKDFKNVLLTNYLVNRLVNSRKPYSIFRPQ